MRTLISHSSSCERGDSGFPSWLCGLAIGVLLLLPLGFQLRAQFGSLDEESLRGMRVWKSKTWAIGEPRRMASGDLNGDGMPDLILTTQARGDESGMWNSRLFTVTSLGGNNFEDPVLVEERVVWDAPWGELGAALGFVMDPVTRDLDEDGDVDIVAVWQEAGEEEASFVTTILIFWNDGDGIYKAEEHPVDASILFHSRFSIGDLNGDVLPDIAIPLTSDGAIER